VVVGPRFGARSRLQSGVAAFPKNAPQAEVVDCPALDIIQVTLEVSYEKPSANNDTGTPACSIDPVNRVTLAVCRSLPVSAD